MSEALQSLMQGLEDFSVAAEDNVLLKMEEFCVVYGLQPDDMVTNWIAFCATKHIDMQPTLDLLSQFEREELLKSAKKAIKSKKSYSTKNSSTPVIFDSSTINEFDMDVKHDQVSFENRKSNHMKSPSSVPFSPSSFSPSQSTPSARYASRKAAGDVVCSFGTTKDIVWTSTGQLSCIVRPHSEESALKTRYTYMFEKFRDCASVLNDMIVDTADRHKETHNVIDWNPVHLPSMEPVPVVGRICSEDGLKLNVQSILLEGSHETSSGRTVSLDVSQLEKFSFFPGQIIAGQGINSVGKKLVLKTLYEDAFLPFPSEVPDLNEGLVVVIAAGPFTTMDALSFEPLADLLKYLKSNKPHVCFLCGPFVDVKHEEIEKGELSETYQDIFEGVIKMIMSGVDDITVVLVPSIRDVHHEPVYPTPPYDIKTNYKNLYLASDPCVLNISGIVFGVTSTDILFHLGKEEIHFSPQHSDRLGRLCRHLLTQRNFYPLYPPAENVNIDYIHFEAHCMLSVTPHILIVPSDLRYFVKNVDGCCCVNPERLTKSYVGGTFARMKIQPIPAAAYTSHIADHICAEIIKI